MIVKISGVPDEWWGSAVYTAKRYLTDYPDRMGIRDCCIYSHKGGPAMINFGEAIQWGSETILMEQCANQLEADGVTIATLTAKGDAAQAEIEALQRELRATVAERNRAQKDCELIVKRFTPKPIRFAPKDRMIIGVERPPQEERTFFYDLIWCPDREDFVSPFIRSLNGATHYLDPRNMIGIVWPREVAAIKKGAAT